MLHHRDGRQELHGACHLAGDEVGTLLRGLSNLSTQDVQLLKPQTQQKVTRERPDPGRDLIVPSSAALNGRKSKPQEEKQSTSNGCLSSQLHKTCAQTNSPEVSNSHLNSLRLQGSLHYRYSMLNQRIRNTWTPISILMGTYWETEAYACNRDLVTALL